MKIKSIEDVKSAAAYLRRINAEVRSLRTAVVKEMHGSYWKDLAVITFGKDGKVKAPEAYAPTQQEAALIESELATVIWPKLKLVKRMTNLPDELAKAQPKDIFEFRDVDGNIIMLQLRMERKGEKSYIPYTYWDDNTWRCMEPEGKLPLWGIEQLKDYSTVFIHEGAKAARHIAKMVSGNSADDKQALKDHPWGDELASAAHLGWIGGALSPARTDWAILQKLGVKRAYIVSDNDSPGLAAVPAISYQLRVPTFHIQFTSEWPASFDLADDFPKKMFKQMEGKNYFIGPSFRSCLHPATWATDQVPNKSGKPTNVLRDNFKEMWAYIEEADLFVCVDMPEILRSEPVMNKMLAGFSHTNSTSHLIVKSYQGRSARLCYRPDIKGRIVTDKTTSAINLHSPTHIKATEGSIKPFMEFMEYMFPIETERKEVERYCATLIAKPEVRMLYGLLLVSEAQGVGKTTLGASILAPLVGDMNTGFPNEDDIVNSGFNGWLANKRLIVIGEIYSGHSWKAYNKLKGFITDKDIVVNEKYMRAYRVENWAHIFACSNSRRALRVENDDRRWFYPEVTEVRWPREKFEDLHVWLGSGGLGIIKRWAEKYGDYIATGDRARMTERKRDLIKNSRSDAQQEVAALAESVTDGGVEVAFAMKDIVEWCKATIKGRVFDSDYDLRKTMKEMGMVIYERRFKVGGRLQYVILSPALKLKSQKLDEAAEMDLIKSNLKKPGEIFDISM